MKWRPVTLFLGMYAITSVLFWVKTGSLVTGLSMGVLSAGLKTAWSLLHSRLTHTKTPSVCERCANQLIP